MATTIPIAPTPVPSGTTHMPAAGATVPPGFTQYAYGIDTSSYTSADVISVFSEYSQDAGVTWHFDGGWTGVGGPHLSRIGTTVLPGSFGPLPPDLGQGVLMRGIVTVPRAGTLSGTVTLS